MNSIKRRMVGSFMFIILISVSIFEVLLINFVRQYYYNNLEAILTNQIQVSADFYNRYFSNTSLEDNILDNVDVFWKQTNAEVQIIDLNGKVLMDSIGVMPKGKIETADFASALKGQKGKWIGDVQYDTSGVMAITYPLKSSDKIVGVLRFITSLQQVNDAVKKISIVFLTIGAIVILITGVVSLFLAFSIVNPIKEVTDVAEKMAAGDLSIRSKKTSNDEIGKLSDTLNYMADEILKKEQLKNEFISSVSHELRTPLTAIKGWALTLNTDQLEDTEILHNGLSIIEKESERLTAMVEELLDFSKFISGKITLKKERTDMVSLIQYIESYMSLRAQREKIEFKVEYAQYIPSLEIDNNRIKQVFINVLDNAFKFTEQGGQVSFVVQVEENYVGIKISDSGCGISEEELPKVKEKFYKGKSSKSQNGIGLSICDEIMKMHKGIFLIESKINEGTTVSIKLPIT